MECSWRISDDRFRIQWIALKTFTGSQLKYVLPKKRSPLLFALADEDAYVYCDKDVCLESVSYTHLDVYKRQAHFDPFEGAS